MRSGLRSAWASLAGSIRVQNRGMVKDREYSKSSGTKGDTYRVVYTVKFEHAMYVLHAFQKKSPKGVKTTRTDIELISKRLRIAAADYEARYGKRKN